jgi:NitT/TauT family transport system substrate-binding protein
MTMTRSKQTFVAWAARALVAMALIGGAVTAGGQPAAAEQIAVGNYAIAANGMPYGVALAKGYFKEEGADIDGIISSQGGGTSVRNMIAGGVAYGEANPGAIAVANLQGADLVIIADTVQTVAEFIWAVKPDSPVKSIADLKGRKIGYTNPRSTSQALAILLLEKTGLKAEDAELVKTGGFGEGVAALDAGLIDVAPMAEPVWSKFKDKFRGVVTAAEALPPLTNVVGFTTRQMAESRGDFIRAVIRARRKAVAFMEANPDEAGDIVAKAYNLDPAVGRSAVGFLVKSKTQGIPYWGTGQFNVDGLKRIIEVQKMVGALTGEIDIMKMVDTRFLPDDIKALR